MNGKGYWNIGNGFKQRNKTMDHDLRWNNHKHMPYPKRLELTPSILRPHVAAKDRLKSWKPVKPHRDGIEEGNSTSLSEKEADNVFAVMSAAWAESTKVTYGTRLLLFHIFCNFWQVMEEMRAPVTHSILEAFMAATAGAYSN